MTAAPTTAHYWTKPHTLVGIGLAASIPLFIACVFARDGDLTWGRALGVLAVFGGTYMSGFVGGMVLQGSLTEMWRRGANDALRLANQWCDIARSAQGTPR